LFLDGYFTKQQIRRGIDRIYIDAENIKEDVPDLEEYIAQALLKLVKEEVITKQVLLKIPLEIREEVVKYAPFKSYFASDLTVFDGEKETKEKFAELVNFYLESYDSSDIFDHLKNIGNSDIVIPWFIRKAILVSSGKGNKDREKVSQLLKDMPKKLDTNYAMYSYAFDH